MRASAIFAELSACPGWADKSKKMRWLASRYYAGVDSLDDLRRLSQPIPVSGNFLLKPALSVAEVDEIISLR